MKIVIQSVQRYVLAACLVVAAGVVQAESLPDFTSIVAREGPAVVNISSTQIVKQRGLAGLEGLPDNDPLSQLLKRYLQQNPQSRQPHERQEESLGSGFIISPDGYIMTNAHVVEGADEVEVKLTDRREFKAKVIGSDKRSDVALLKISANHLPVVTMGDASTLKPGQWVVAIGQPFGLENSVTQGIVSATQRSLPSDTLVPFIQTDVPINPGNSGGPLFNLQGQVIGINSQIYSRTGGYMGLSFAIPIDVALNVTQQLRSTGHVVRGRLGIAIQDVSKGLADSFGLSQAQGALISNVDASGPAAKAGLQPADVVLRYNGHVIITASDLQRLVSATQPGSIADVQVWRKGHVQDIRVKVGVMPEEKTAQAHPVSQPAPKSHMDILGMALANLTPAQQQRLKVSNGLLVEQVQGLADREGIERGDVILELNDVPLHSVAQFNALLARFGAGHTVALRVKRGAATIYVPLQIPGKGR
jgi:serine protease Do